jgi:phosphate butyryltransferase
LPAGTVLSHVTVLEVPAYHKLLVVSDVAVLPCPTLEQKKQIAKYLIATANNLGIECPKVALLAPSEQLLPKVVSSVEAKELSDLGQAGELGNALFQGPLALDVAIDEESVKIKKLTGPVAGDADCMLFPNLESGNVFFKACSKFGGAELAAMVAGPTAPCVLTSRGDSTKTKLYSIALACLSAK